MYMIDPPQDPEEQVPEAVNPSNLVEAEVENKASQIVAVVITIC
jgi:hypothetical protein